MTKYNDKFKLTVVKTYLEGNMGYPRLAKYFNITNEASIKQWVRAYKKFGEEGIRIKRTKEIYSVQFKLDVLNFMKKTGASLQDTAIEFNMNNPSLIQAWKSKFLKGGIEALKGKKKGRSPMSKKMHAKFVKQNKPLSREQQLERENELLRLEVAYLKKLKTFQENPNAFLEKYRQRWHSNSKKKDSD